jgi:hypothetical protein
MFSPWRLDTFLPLSISSPLAFCVLCCLRGWLAINWLAGDAGDGGEERRGEASRRPLVE